MQMSPKLREKLEDFLDSLEEEYGTLEGVEIKLDHPIVDGERQSYAEVKEFIIYHITKTPVKIRQTTEGISKSKK